MTTEKTIILNSLQVEQKIQRIAHEIYENHFNDKKLILVGIAKRGAILAARLQKILSEISDLELELIELRIDKNHPQKSIDQKVLKNANLENQVVLLIDDVLNSGKTLIFGAKHILDYPVKRLCTVTMVNRKHRLYPIRADYVGLSLSTTIEEHIEVELGEGKDAVYLC